MPWLESLCCEWLASAKSTSNFSRRNHSPSNLVTAVLLTPEFRTCVVNRNHALATWRRGTCPSLSLPLQIFHAHFLLQALPLVQQLKSPWKVLEKCGALCISDTIWKDVGIAIHRCNVPFDEIYRKMLSSPLFPHYCFEPLSTPPCDRFVLN